jgi:hypothetical protein
MSVAPKKRLLNLFMAMSMAAAVSVSAQDGGFASLQRADHFPEYAERQNRRLYA